MTTSILATDGYKFSMAEAGWPLRRETFYYSHRKGGWQLMPVDVDALVRGWLPSPAEGDWAYLTANEYGMGEGFKAAIARQNLVVQAVPKGAWFYDREPAFSLTGWSALVSWYEPLLLQLNFRIQVATLAARDPEGAARTLAVATCERERAIVLETLDAIGARAFPIRVDSDGYRARVLATARELVEIAGSPDRLFEVGMRAASCLEQHAIALEAVREAGISRTSNVLLARQLGMIPVGTMGHEHVQRFGSDEAAFRAMRDRRPNRSSFLLDTFDTIKSGLRHAYAVIREEPSRGDSIRFDSGDKVAQYRHAVGEARRQGVSPVYILEDGFDAAMTREFEALRRELDVDAGHQVYGYGGTLVAKPGFHALTRDRVSAVYKLSQTGPAPTMKFANEAGGGKESVPGEPVVFRRAGAGDAGRPLGLIAQAGEQPPAGYVRLTNGDPASSPAELFDAVPEAARRAVPTERTQKLIDGLRAKRHEALEGL